MKKFLALLTLVCMVLTATAAFAFPSKTASDLTTIVPGAASTGVELDPGFSIFITEPTEAIEEEVAAIYEHVAEAPIATYFDEETQAQLAELVEDPSALLGYEAVAVACANYLPEYGDVDADMTFATVFPEGSEVIVMIKTADAWLARTCVAENGAVKVTFTADELASMNETPSLLLALANEIAE